MNKEVFQLFNEGVKASLEAQDARNLEEHASADHLEEKAAAAFEQVLQLDPNHVGALGGKGLSLAHLGRTQEAIPLFERAIELDPDFAENHRQLGLCYAELGDIDAARGAILRAIELNEGPEYRQHVAIELYNFGGYAMQQAAQHRDAGQRAEEQQCYQYAHALFNLALEIDSDNQHVIRALEIVNNCLQGNE